MTVADVREVFKLPATPVDLNQAEQEAQRYERGVRFHSATEKIEALRERIAVGEGRVAAAVAAGAEDGAVAPARAKIATLRSELASLLADDAIPAYWSRVLYDAVKGAEVLGPIPFSDFHGDETPYIAVVISGVYKASVLLNGPSDEPEGW